MNMEPRPSTQMPLGNGGRVNFLREEMLETPAAAEEDWSLLERGLVMHAVTTGCLTPSINCGAKRRQLHAVDTHCIGTVLPARANPLLIAPRPRHQPPQAYS